MRRVLTLAALITAVTPFPAVVAFLAYERVARRTWRQRRERAARLGGLAYLWE